jgi:hypothetical protein
MGLIEDEPDPISPCWLGPDGPFNVRDDGPFNVRGDGVPFNVRVTVR